MWAKCAKVFKRKQATDTVQKNDRFTLKYTVSDAIYRGFIDAFNDRNPLHTDTSFALQRGFKSKVMHGNILGGFLSHFIGECLPMKNVIIHSQEIKYMLPVYLEDTLTLEAAVADVFESVGVVEFTYYFQNEVGQKVAKGKINIGILAS